jgi:CheY-like chemotaxis protein
LAHALPKCNILEAKNADDALAAALAQSPDVLLVDLRFLKEKEIQVIRELRTTFRDLYIVAVTDEESQVSQADCELVGAHAYVSRREVIHFLESLIR